MTWNSSFVRFSMIFCLPHCIENSSCMWKPSHMRLTMSMPNVPTRFDLVLGDGGRSLLKIVGVDVAV